MDRRLVTMIAMIIMILAAGCDQVSVPNDVKSVGFGNFLQTAEHDGHKWVICSTSKASGGVSIVHHPDCQCSKPK